MSMSEDCASFIRARDPSILAWNRPPINPAIRMDLCTKYSSGSSTASFELNDENDKVEEESNPENFEVYLRIKPSPNINELYDFNEKKLKCYVPLQDGNKITKEYSFSKIHGPHVNQTDLFNDSVKRKVLAFINGRNSTIFTYGTSGSGKTFTILGTSEEPGVIPRSLEYLFSTIPPVDEQPKVKPTQSGEIKILNSNDYLNEQRIRNKIMNSSSTAVDKAYGQTYKMMQKMLTTEPIAILADTTDVSVAIWVSFAEVYNEYVYDLLIAAPARGKQRPKLRLGQDKKGNTFIRDLTNISVCSGLQAYEILQYGMQNLNYASTSMNSHSSRSHCIFTIKLVQLSPDGFAQISNFNFCDLAGSERVKNTHNVGERLKESNNINTSLHVLGRCIKSIRESQKNGDTKLVPFRESKLTRLFQRALTGQEAIAMIVNINPSRHMFDESQHVLNFSAIAKDISIEKVKKPNKMPVNKRFSEYIQSRSTSIAQNAVEQNEVDILREQVLMLSLELEQQRQLFAVKELEIRREIVNAFQERNKHMTDYWKKIVQEQKQDAEDDYKSRIKNIEDYYKNMLNERQIISTVIDLDSTTYDEIEELKVEVDRIQNSLNEYKKRNSALEAEKTQLEFQLSAQNSTIENTKIKMQQMSLDFIQERKKNLEYEQIINDAEEELAETVNENKELKNKLAELLINQLEDLKHVNTSYILNRIEELEDEIDEA